MHGKWLETMQAFYKQLPRQPNVTYSSVQQCKTDSAKLLRSEHAPSQWRICIVSSFHVPQLFIFFIFSFPPPFPFRPPSSISFLFSPRNVPPQSSYGVWRHWKLSHRGPQCHSDISVIRCALKLRLMVSLYSYLRNQNVSIEAKPAELEREVLPVSAPSIAH